MRLHRALGLSLALVGSAVAGRVEAAESATVTVLSTSTSSTQPGGRVSFSVRVQNSGTTTWSPIGTTFSPDPSASGGIPYPQQSGSYYLQLEFFKLDAANPYDPNAVIQSLTPMPSVLSAGQSASIDSYFNAPSATGRWGVTFQMVRVSVYAFASRILTSPQDAWNMSPRHEFQVSTCTAPGSFGLSSPAQGQVLPSGTTSATLQWGGSSGATAYDVYFGGASSPPLIASQSGTSRSVTVADGQTYSWKVVARNSCGSTAASTGTASFSVAAPAQDPGVSSTLRLESGTVAGQAVSPSSRTVTVAPGAQIVGQLNVRVDSTYGSNSVMAMAVTPSWGSHASSYQDLGGFSTPVTGLVRTVPITFVAPSTPGTYSIIVAYRAEYTAAQVMSCTNWAAGSPVWDDGNDVADWSSSTLATANANGTVPVPYRLASGSSVHVPATAITVVVSGSGSGSPILYLQKGKVAVSVTYRNQYSGETGIGKAIPQKEEFGFFYFVDVNVPEVFVKVLDWGTDKPYLLFHSGLTDFAYTVTFQNVATGKKVVFEKPASFLCGGIDTTELTH